jgi:hypothetical protein
MTIATPMTIIPQREILDNTIQWEEVSFEHQSMPFTFRYKIGAVMSTQICFVWNFERILYPFIPTTFFMAKEGPGSYIYGQTTDGVVKDIIGILINKIPGK